MNKLIWNAFAHELEKVGGNASFFQKLKNKTTERFKTIKPSPAAQTPSTWRMPAMKEYPVQTETIKPSPLKSIAPLKP